MARYHRDACLAGRPPSASTWPVALPCYRPSSAAVRPSRQPMPGSPRGWLRHRFATLHLEAGEDPLTNNAIVDEQIAGRLDLASDQFELNRWQAVEESSSAADDHRPDHEPEFVDNVGGEQRLHDRDTSVGPDVAAGLLLGPLFSRLLGFRWNSPQVPLEHAAVQMTAERARNRDPSDSRGRAVFQVTVEASLRCRLERCRTQGAGEWFARRAPSACTASSDATRTP